MPIEQIISLLIQERERLNQAIEALQGNSRGERRPANARGGSVSSGDAERRSRRPMTAAEKKAHSERMKAFWAKRRAAKK